LQGTLEEWHLVFYVAGVAYAIGMIAYLVFSSDEIQPWAKFEQEEEEDEKGETEKEKNVLLDCGGGGAEEKDCGSIRT
jgi:hypothetical protein